MGRGKGAVMGPHERRPVPLDEAGGAPDYVKEIRAMEAAHPTLTYIAPQGEDDPHAATWNEDDGAHQAARAELRNLVLYLRARFGAR